MLKTKTVTAGELIELLCQNITTAFELWGTETYTAPIESLRKLFAGFPEERPADFIERGYCYLLNEKRLPMKGYKIDFQTGAVTFYKGQEARPQPKKRSGGGKRKRVRQRTAH